MKFFYESNIDVLGTRARSKKVASAKKDKTRICYFKKKLCRCNFQIYIWEYAFCYLQIEGQIKSKIILKQLLESNLELNAQILKLSEKAKALFLLSFPTFQYVILLLIGVSIHFN